MSNSVSTATNRTGIIARYDWPVIRGEFIEGILDTDGRTWPTIPDLARRHDLPHQTIRLRHREEDWDRQRREYQEQIETARRTQRADLIARDAAEIDSLALASVKSTLRLGLQKLQMLEVVQGLRSIEDLDLPAPPEQPQDLYDDDDELVAKGMPDVMGERGIKTIIEAVSAAHQLGSKVMGFHETARLEITGAGGGPIQSEERVSVSEQLSAPSAKELAGVLQALGRTIAASQPEGDDEILDAEVVDETQHAELDP